MKYVLIISIFFYCFLNADVLEEYVKKNDNAFSWEKISKVENVYKLSFTSQKWQGKKWYHHLLVVVPDKISPKSTALLWISGSGSGNTEVKFAQKIAKKSQCPVFILMAVPNQPMFGSLWEDALLSYTIVKAMEKNDPQWLILLPMVKSATQAMNVAEKFFAKTFKKNITGFVVTGGSKRGWTTWLTAAIDKRVKAIAPIVFDNLNFSKQMKNQKKMWNNYSEEIGDYADLIKKLETPKGQMVTNIIDPYSYRHLITVPKFMIMGTNDKYWPLNAADMYFKKLQGPAYLCYIPNNGHRIKNTGRIRNILVMALKSIQHNITLPKFSWKFKEEKENVKISFDASKNVKEIKIWRTDANTKDFREASWKDFYVPSFAKSIRVARRRLTYRATFVEVIFDFEGGEVSFSSSILITKGN